MKKTINYLLGVLVLVGCVGFFACSSDNKVSEPTKPDYDTEIKTIKKELLGYWSFGESGEVKGISFNEDETYKLLKNDNTYIENTYSVERIVATKAELKKINYKDYRIVLKGYGNLEIKSLSENKLEVESNGDIITAKPSDPPAPKPDPEDYELGFLAYLEEEIALPLTDIVLTNEAGEVIKRVCHLNKGDYRDGIRLMQYNPETGIIYFESYSDYTVSISAVNIATGEIKVIAKFSERDSEKQRIEITKDGREIFFSNQNRELNVAPLYKYDVASGKETMISDINSDADYTLSVGDDASVISFCGYDGPIYTMKKGEKEKIIVPTNDNIIQSLISASPDGSLMFYMTEYEKEDKPKEYYIIGTDGSNKKAISMVNAPDLYIESSCWSADNKYIYFDDYAKEGRLYKYDIETEQVSKVTDKFVVEHLYDTAISVIIPKEK